MKTPIRFVCRLSAILLLCAAGLLPLDTHAADAGPAISLKRALELSQQALVDKGVANEVYIISIVLKHTTMTASQAVWEAAWSAPIAGSKPGRDEVGVQVNMSGEVIHLLKGRGEVHRVPPPR